MNYALWITTTVTFFVLLAYAVEQLADTYTAEVAQREAELDALDDLCPQYK